MIEIANLKIIDCLNKTRLSCDLIVDGCINNIWYEFDAEYRAYICTERIDGVLVNILLYCMENGHDITSNIPVSEKLYYQLVNFLIPSISGNIAQYKKIEINAPVDFGTIETKNAVGTGCSGGVDSFYSILKNTDIITKSYNITHLTFFNAGASGNYGGDEARELFQNRYERMRHIANDLNLPLIAVDTNINEFLQQEHTKTHTFRSLAIPLLLQKLFGVYYYSSGYGFNDVHFDYKGTAPYDLLTCTCLSNENIVFYSSGGESDRINKVDYISNFDITFKHLNVCVSEESNCGRCSKCRRTILELYALNKLDNYNKVFSINEFHGMKNKWLGEMLSCKKTDTYMREIYDTLREKNIKIPLSSRTYWRIYFCLLQTLKKAYHFIKR